jgi:hypothetical protein
MVKFLVGLSVLGLSCLPKVPKQRLNDTASVAVAFLVDPSYSGVATAPPAQLMSAVTRELEAHNLKVIEVPTEVVAAQRLTDSRFEALKRSSLAQGAPFLLLVEQRVQFFSQIDGRYRWEVATSLTASRSDGSMAKDPFEIPVVLTFDHEKEREAIVTAASDVASRIGVLMDGLLVGYAPTPPPTPAAVEAPPAP